MGMMWETPQLGKCLVLHLPSADTNERGACTSGRREDAGTIQDGEQDNFNKKRYSQMDRELPVIGSGGQVLPLVTSPSHSTTHTGPGGHVEEDDRIGSLESRLKPEFGETTIENPPRLLDEVVNLGEELVPGKALPPGLPINLVKMSDRQPELLTDLPSEITLPTRRIPHHTDSLHKYQCPAPSVRLQTISSQSVS